MTPDLTGLALLDAGCGTGRRLAGLQSHPRRAIGVDLVPEMLAQATDCGDFAAADVRALPFDDATFDVVWCRMALGHVPDLALGYCELARVTRPSGLVIVSDFHARAVQAGHRRTFRDSVGDLKEVEHHMHDAEAHRSSAADAGLSLERMLEAPAGDRERNYYARAGRLGQFERERDLPLVLVASLRR